jgi:hypothetical protein
MRLEHIRNPLQRLWISRALRPAQTNHRRIRLAQERDADERADGGARCYDDKNVFDPDGLGDVATCDGADDGTCMVEKKGGVRSGVFLSEGYVLGVVEVVAYL